MSRKNKTTVEVLTDPEQIADLASQLRESDFAFAEKVEGATQVCVRKEGGEVVEIEVPGRGVLSIPRGQF